MRYWATDNPHEVCPTFPLIIELYFFEDRDRKVTVNSNSYVRIFHDFFQPRLTEFIQNVEEEDLGEVWLKQDGVIAHIAR